MIRKEEAGPCGPASFASFTDGQVHQLSPDFQGKLSVKPEAPMNVCGQPNVLQILSHVAKLPSRFAGLELPVLADAHA